MEKRGTILVENVIFIILNFVYLSILVAFLVNQATDASIIEQSYSKQIALLIDSAKPGMEIYLNMEDAFDKAEKSEYSGEIVRIVGNQVIVKVEGTDERRGYTYSFFNDVDVNVAKFPSDKGYFFQVGEKNE